MPRCSFFSKLSLEGSYTRSQVNMLLTALWGGYVAEHLLLKESSNAGADDLKKVNLLAHRMVHDWGMGKTERSSLKASNDYRNDAKWKPQRGKSSGEQIRERANSIGRCFGRKGMLVQRGH
jgi:ATP-dependent Zn protease